MTLDSIRNSCDVYDNDEKIIKEKTNYNRPNSQVDRLFQMDHGAISPSLMALFNFFFSGAVLAMSVKTSSRSAVLAYNAGAANSNDFVAVEVSLSYNNNNNNNNYLLTYENNWILGNMLL